jgi:hypothetical protein
LRDIGEWVRLKADLASLQWTKSNEDGCNAGYHISACFFAGLEDKIGRATQFQAESRRICVAEVLEGGFRTKKVHRRALEGVQRVVGQR